MDRRALILPMLLIAALASAQKPLDIAKKNLEAERKANLMGDVVWFEKNQTADYVSIDKKGKKETKDEEIAKTKSAKSFMKVTQVDASVLSAKMVGKDLVATVRIRMVGTLKGGDGKSHAFDYKETSEETWTKVGGVWKQRIAKTLTEGGTIDGTPMPD